MDSATDPTVPRGSSPLKVVAWLLLVAALVINPWVLGGGIGLGLLRKALLLVVSVFLLTYGLHALLAARRGQGAMAWIASCHAFAAAQTFNFLLLFVLFNLGALLLPRPQPLDINLSELYHSPERLYQEDREFLTRKIYPGLSDQDVFELIYPPGSLHHPTLEYVAPVVASKHYRVGIEGIRLDSRLVEDELPGLLREGAVWMFGGSTMFGANISNDDTISGHLNRLDHASRYLNFGVPSYHQNLEIDKLLLLLRKGYRPRKVVFLDGWNDITALRSSDFHPLEMPAKTIHAYGSICNVENFRQGTLLWTLRKLPLFDQLLRWQESALPVVKPSLGTDGCENLFESSADYRQQPFRHYDFIRRRQFDHDQFLAGIDRHQQRLRNYYLANDDFLDRLARSYGFEVHVFLQPMGSLSEANPFLRTGVDHKGHPYYRSTLALVETARRMIAGGELKHFHDIIDADSRTKAGYVDAAHYDSSTCEAIAGRMLRILDPSNTPPR